MKKTFILATTALLVSASAFAWSKKTEGQANLGRTYVAIDGFAGFNKYEYLGEKSTPTTGGGGIAFNVPVFKPNVNALEGISWFGLDAQVGFSIGGGDFVDDSTVLQYNVGFALIPYLNFETGWSFLQAIKPFGYGKVSYNWYDFSGENNSFEDINYFGYSAGGGVELVLTSALSVTGAFNWYGSQEGGIPNTTSVSLEATYWVNGMFAMSFFGEYNFGDTYEAFDNVDVQRGTTIGVKFKLGFNR